MEELDSEKLAALHKSCTQSLAEAKADDLANYAKLETLVSKFVEAAVAGKLQEAREIGLEALDLEFDLLCGCENLGPITDVVDEALGIPEDMR